MKNDCGDVMNLAPLAGGYKSNEITGFRDVHTPNCILNRLEMEDTGIKATHYGLCYILVLMNALGRVRE